ncbi:uncharacterized protein BP5553_06265 [Venustampulla echinocandica]|uniref:Uncharacterized protein n=1 Tax=Venustampulla echinocandica TaxID=2656787 RepID=A0A370TMZ6_9HELO|nr:uncharacterized protein BP5553_06265 [Venustampulla echinocandica]RDL36913.1 hypothetical protein BP5553_06265 [Venustampulla echinocandica]
MEQVEQLGPEKIWGVFDSVYNGLRRQERRGLWYLAVQSRSRLEGQANLAAPAGHVGADPSPTISTIDTRYPPPVEVDPSVMAPSPSRMQNAEDEPARQPPSSLSLGPDISMAKGTKKEKRAARKRARRAREGDGHASGSGPQTPPHQETGDIFPGTASFLSVQLQLQSTINDLESLLKISKAWKQDIDQIVELKKMLESKFSCPPRQ